MMIPTLPSDITFEKYKEQYELYQYAHNGYAQYLSYQLSAKDAEITSLKSANKTLQDELAEIKKKLESEVDQQVNILRNTGKVIRELEKQLSEALDVVRFYADEDSWGENPEDRYFYNVMRVDDSWQEKHWQTEFKTSGKRAREFLSKIEKEKV